MQPETYTIRVSLHGAGLQAKVSGGILKGAIECGPATTRAALFGLVATYLRRAEFSQAMALPFDQRTTLVAQDKAAQTYEMFTAAVERTCVRFKGSVSCLRELRPLQSIDDATSVVQKTELLADDESVLAAVYLRRKGMTYSTEIEIPVR